MGERRAGTLRRLRARSATVRVRTASAAIISVGVALMVAALLMVVLLGRWLTDDVRSASLIRATTAAQALSAGKSIAAIPVVAEDEEFIQVLNGQGQVSQSTSNLAGRSPILRLAPGESRRIHGVPDLNNDDIFLVVAVPADTPSGRFTVIVGRSLQTVNDTTHSVGRLLAIGLPLVMVVVGLVAWRLVGRALSPVEQLRAEVEAISARGLHRRVADPPGEDEIAGLAKTMNRMLTRLEQGQSGQRRFVSDASHELRSPLATIRQHAEVALRHPESTSTAELASVVLEEEVRLQRLVDDLLFLAKVDEAGQRHTESVDIDDILFEEAKRLKATTVLAVDIAGVAPGRVSGDKDQLDRLVRNLVDNAARHAVGRVAMGLQEDEGGVVLTVDNDGEGIPASDRERVFERFVRLDAARTRDSGGSGLGLAIVAEIAAAHGASVTVGESPAGGARFTVSFPPPPA